MDEIEAEPCLACSLTVVSLMVETIRRPQTEIGMMVLFVAVRHHQTGKEAVGSQQKDVEESRS